MEGSNQSAETPPEQKVKKKISRRTIFLIVLICLIVLLAGYGIYRRYFTREGESSIFSKLRKSVTTAPQALSTLDGQFHNQGTANRHPLAIMIENSPEARPHSGLTSASLIYEAITEGGITRFMAVFGPEGSDKIGPVRSARGFFLDWAAEYDAFYAHVGGSQEALDRIGSEGIKDLNQFGIGTKAFWRVPQSGKATEHTMYTDTNKLWDIAQKNGWSLASSFDALSFKRDALTSERATAQTIKINFSSPTFEVIWQYNPSDNLYYRKLGGGAHKDAKEGKQLTAKNVIVQEVSHWQEAYQGKDVWKMTTTGEGKVKVFMDGKMTEGKWKKASQKSRTKFYDNNGKEISFNPGVFWYEIVPPESPVTVL
jgi:hypothetical protein